MLYCAVKVKITSYQHKIDYKSVESRMSMFIQIKWNVFK